MAIQAAKSKPMCWYAAGVNFQDRLAGFIATGFGSGFSPYASGTAGSALALILFYPLSFTHWSVQLGVVLFFLFVGRWSAEVCYRSNGVKDDGRIVVDEFIGMWITLLAQPFEWFPLLMGFLLFRALDIFKPFPADYFDQRESAWGVMLDDLVSGVYAMVVLRLMIEALKLL